MTRYDKFLIGAVLIFSTVIFFVGNMMNDIGEQHLIAVVMVNGKEYRRIDLKNSVSEEFVVHTSSGHNTIETGKDKIRIKESTCPDKLCIKQGWISRPNQIVVCLPNRVYIKIIGGEDEVDDVSF